jgi:hypothetical protein
MDYKNEGMAEWDQRQAFHQRLHTAILFAHNSMFSNDYRGWFKALTVLEIELSSHLRKEEEKETVKNNMERVRITIQNNFHTQNKFEVFLKAQKTMHQIMRARGFDVPVNEKNPGQILRE